MRSVALPVHRPAGRLRPPAFVLLAGLALVTLVARPAARAAEVPPTADLPSIFNGTDLTGWHIDGEAYWRVADGVIVGESDSRKKASMLYTDASYGDVIVEGEVRFSGEIDSGIMVRKPQLQVQIGVSRSLKKDMTCSFYTGKYPEEARASKAAELLEPGEWNRIRVEAKGDTFTVWLNGEEVSRYRSDAYPEPAPIGLQIHPGVVMKVEFRDLRAKPLGPAKEGAIPAKRDDFHVFLLMGQSNMAGAGRLLPGDKDPVPGVVLVPTRGPEEFAWRPAAHPVHNRMGSDQFGLGLPFAIAYRRTHPGVTVGLIPVAVGGASIGSLHKGSRVYADALAKARWAASAGIVKGVLWHQGENETVNLPASEIYAKALDKLVADLRADLDDPTLPFIAGNLGEFYGGTHAKNRSETRLKIANVRRALRELPARVPHTAFVESTGLTCKGDFVHFDRASLVELGERYAQALASVTGEPAPPPAAATEPATAAAPQPSGPLDPWPAAKAWEWYRAQPWIVGVNFLPSTASNPAEMWAADTFDEPTIARELGLAKQLGFNSCRVFLQHLVWKQDPAGMKQRLERFLAVAHGHGLTTTLVLFDDGSMGQPLLTDPQPGKQRDPIPGMCLSSWAPNPGVAMVTDQATWPDLEPYVKDLVGAFGRDPRVLMWDVYSEPSQGRKSVPLVDAAFRWAREAAPAQPLTAYWLGKARCDVISFHAYTDARGLRGFIEQYKREGRPVVCTEWMARTSGSSWATDLPLLKQEGVGCYSWGLVNGRTQGQFTWSDPPNTPEPKVWCHDLFRRDGTPYDPAEHEVIRRQTADKTLDWKTRDYTRMLTPTPPLFIRSPL